MKLTAILVATCCTAIFGAANCHADSLTANFNLACSSVVTDACAAGGAAPASVASVGQVTLSLNGNGSIAVNVDYTGSYNLWAFAINSPTDLPVSGLSSPAANSPNWNDVFGQQDTGFSCFSSGTCGWTSTSFTIDGTYSSVYQVLGGDSTNPYPSSVDFWLFVSDSTTQYGADAPANPAATPEPSSFLLLGSGLAGLAGLAKRRAQLLIRS